MVDQESGTYRPRRAFIEPDVEPVPPLRPAQPGRNGNGRAPVRPEPVEGRPSRCIGMTSGRTGRRDLHPGQLPCLRILPPKRP
jgi:hypothetical protein